MEILHSKNILNTPFRVTTESIQNKPGTWNSTKVSIYRDSMYDIQANVYRQGLMIGEYLRNYSNFGFDTFYPFQIENEWYALYSANYTATRVMKLHEDRIEDWCGEESHSNGFCPVEYYVPRYVHVEHKHNLTSGEEKRYDIFYVDCDFKPEEFRTEIENPELAKLDYCKFGFMAGCVWGDDTCWKLRYIDLSEVPNKILTITEKFGYWELPNLPLKECIRMDGWEPGHEWITLIKQQYIDLMAP